MQLSCSPCRPAPRAAWRVRQLDGPSAGGRRSSCSRRASDPGSNGAAKPDRPGARRPPSVSPFAYRNESPRGTRPTDGRASARPSERTTRPDPGAPGCAPARPRSARSSPCARYRRWPTTRSSRRHQPASKVRVQLPIEGRFEDSAGDPSEQTTRTDQGHPTSGGPLHQLLRELPLSRCRLRKWSYDLLSAMMWYFPDRSTSYPTDRNPGQTRNLRNPDSPAIAEGCGRVRRFSALWIVRLVGARCCRGGVAEQLHGSAVSARDQNSSWRSSGSSSRWLPV